MDFLQFVAGHYLPPVQTVDEERPQLHDVVERETEEYAYTEFEFGTKLFHGSVFVRVHHRLRLIGQAIQQVYIDAHQRKQSQQAAPCGDSHEDVLAAEKRTENVPSEEGNRIPRLAPRQETFHR